MWLEVGSSSITGVNRQVKVLLRTEPVHGALTLTHTHTHKHIPLKKKKKKEARLKLMPPFWRPQCPVQHVPTSYLLMRRSMTFGVSYFAPVLLNVSFGINAPVLKLNGFRFRSE